MKMDIRLTPNAILDISRRDAKSQPLVQVLEIIFKSPGAGKSSPNRYRLVVSDSVSTLQALLDYRLNDLVTKGTVRRGSVVQLTDYLSNFEQTVISECPKIGDPKPLSGPRLTFQSAPSGEIVLALLGGDSSKTAIFDPTVNPAYQPPALAKNEVPTQITPISALNPDLGEWTLKARVTAKSGLQYHYFDTCVVKVFSFNLLDSGGGEIHVKCSGNAVIDRFYSYVEVGKVYLVSKGNLKHVPKDYKHLKNEWEIILKTTSMLEKCEEDSSIPHQQFSFTPICEVKNAENNSILDVIGIVTNVSPPAFVRCPNGTERVKRKLALKDGTGETVEIYLWGGFCDDEVQVLQDMLAAGVFPVLVVKAGKFYDAGGKSVHTISYSQLFYNPDLPEAHMLRSWFDSGAKNSAAFSISGEPSQGGQKKLISSSLLLITPDISAADKWRDKFDSGAKNAAALCISRDISQRGKKNQRSSSLLFTNPYVIEACTTRRRLVSGAKNTAAMSISGDQSQGVLKKFIPTGQLLRNIDITASADKSRNWFGSGSKSAAAARSVSRDTGEVPQENKACKTVSQNKMDSEIRSLFGGLSC